VTPPRADRDDLRCARPASGRAYRGNRYVGRKWLRRAGTPALHGAAGLSLVVAGEVTRPPGCDPVFPGGGVTSPRADRNDLRCARPASGRAYRGNRYVGRKRLRRAGTPALHGAAGLSLVVAGEVTRPPRFDPVSPGGGVTSPRADRNDLRRARPASGRAYWGNRYVGRKRLRRAGTPALHGAAGLSLGAGRPRPANPWGNSARSCGVRSPRLH